MIEKHESVMRSLYRLTKENPRMLPTGIIILSVSLVQATFIALKFSGNKPVDAYEMYNKKYHRKLDELASSPLPDYFARDRE